jgi:hypothetical protein
MPGHARPLVVPNIVSRDVSFISQTSWSELSRLPLGFIPLNVVVDETTGSAFIATDRDPVSGLSAVFKIDLTNRAITAQTTLGLLGRFTSIVVSPDGQTVLALDRHQARLYAFRGADLSLRFIRPLCQVCDGVTLPLFSAARLVVTPDSAHVHAVVPVENRVVTVHLASDTIVSSQPFLPAGASTPANGVALFDIAPAIPLIAHPATGIFALDAPSGWMFPVPLFGAGLAPSDVLAVRLGAELLVIGGELNYDSAPDSLELYHVNSGAVLSYPTSETSYAPLFNPRTLEVWSVCRSFPGISPCNPFRIDATNLVAPSQSVTIVGPTATSSGTPRFSTDYGTYLHPVPSLNAVFGVDVPTKQIRPLIPVGTSPSGVF